MKLHWVEYWNNEVVGGRLFGYTASSRFLKIFLLGEGVELTDDAHTAVHYCHPFLYRPIKGKKNIIFTMHESTDIDQDFLRAFANCDGILTPTEFCRDVFRKHERRVPIRVSPLGYASMYYTYKERQRPEVISGSIDQICDRLLWYIDQLEPKMKRGNVLPERPYRPIKLFEKMEPLVLKEPFVYMYSGAPNARKGWARVVSAWSHFFDELPWCLLYAKTSQVYSDGDVSHVNNVIADTRRFVISDLNEMLHEAHCFVSPSMGEGMGLTVLEAMGTGLPIITTKWSGHLDFCNDDNSYFVSHILEKAAQGKEDELLLTAAIADIPDVGRKMVEVFRNYGEALAKGRNGYKLVSSKFTWEKAARKLIENIKELENRR